MKKSDKTVDIVQGDVFFVEMDIPKNAKRVQRTSRGLVLAEGEATGHAHVIMDGGAELFEADGQLYLRVDNEEVPMKHEEHGPVFIDKKEWYVGQVLEYDPFTEEVNKVQD